MPIYRPALSCLLCILISISLFAQVNNAPIFDSMGLIKPGSTLQKLSSEFSFTEGPAADRAGNIFFTDQPNDKIWKFGLDGKLSLFMEKTGRANGLAFDKKGNIIACSDEKNELWSISSTKRISVLMDNLGGAKMNGPNDLWIDKNGGIYFTDPYYQRDYWTRKSPELAGQRIYYLAAGTTQPVMLDSTLLQPNGITGSPDGKWLFVADIRDNKTYRYDIVGDGKIANRKLFVPQGSDGIRLDQHGNLYLTGRGVTIFNPSGVKVGYIPVPSNWVGNLCFGGKDRNILFITASESVYKIEMTVKGAL